jgi:hypothetical protein
MMNKINSKSLLSILLFGFNISINASSAPTIPADLIFNNKPINPLCFDQEESLDKTLSLTNNCELAPIEVVGQSKDLLDKGYVGFEYKVKDITDAASSYSYYKVIGDFNHFYTLYSISNTGGSGHFSSIYLVNRDKDQLHVKTLPFGGDRCNGGLTEVTQNGSTLSFSSNITPGDFLSISNNNPQQLKAYDDLDACAACCVATALYETDLQKDATKATLKSIQFANDSDTLSELKSTDKTGYQACFNKLVLTYIAKNKITLTVTELNSFMDKFNSTCVKK